MRNKKYLIDGFLQLTNFYYLRIFNIVNEFFRNILNVNKEIDLKIH